MREAARITVGIDQTWAVIDKALDGDLEGKFTVDATGTELLLYRDSMSRQVLARDRIAVATSRALRVLPRRARTRLAGLRQRFALRRMARREASHHRRARRGRWSAHGLAPVGSRLRPHAAAVVTHHDWRSESDAQLERVLEILRSSSIEAAVLPGGRRKREVVVLREDDRVAACAALARSLSAPWYVVPLESARARPRRITARRLRRLAARSDGFRLFRYVAAGPDRMLAGAMLGCDVEVWREPRPALIETPHPPLVEAGTLVAPRRNAWTMHLGPDTWEAAGARPGHLVNVGTRPHLFDINDVIDVVYTWVDGSDPQWREAKNAALRARGLPVSDEATDPARFRSHDELKYSLRSLEMYAPWVRRVHIVTAGQRPEWLDVSHPRVRLVDHRDIFADPGVLPVFNSHAIESQLHHIPGLSERYLYLNDDVFFGRPVSKDLFFQGNGLAHFFMSTSTMSLGAARAGESDFTVAAKNSRELIGSLFGRTVTHHFQHAPQPQLKSVLDEMEQRLPEVFSAVAAARFRSDTDVSVTSALHHYYAYARGRSVPGRLEYLYLDLAHPGATSRLERTLRSREFDVICINDTPAVSALSRGNSVMLREFMARYFPLPSSFELPS